MKLHERDEELMLRALELARKGMYTTTPNPRVGCVLVNAEGAVVAEGYHLRAGEAHAEVVALRAAGERARGTTAYVTLEPCNHRGRTGACTEALIAAGVVEVVYGMEDPNPLVAGGGLARLRQSGIRVRGPLLEQQARALNPGFIKRMSTGLPWVRCKMAMSLDGRTAMASGESRWITGVEARADVQRLRAQSCALVTGVGTVLADDPALTVRDVSLGVPLRQPLRVIVDSHARTPKNARVLSEPGRVVLAVVDGVKPKTAIERWQLRSADGRVDLCALLEALARAECNEVLVEAGPRLAGSFLQQGLVDELVMYMAPKLLGNSALPLFDLDIETMEAALSLKIDAITAVGADFRILARPAYNK